METIALHGAGFAGFGWLFLLVPLFWIGVLALFAALFGRRWRRAAWGPGGPHERFAAASTQGAESSLAERYAQGDIDEVEYRARLAVLRASRPQPAPGK